MPPVGNGPLSPATVAKAATLPVGHPVRTSAINAAVRGHNMAALQAMNLTPAEQRYAAIQRTQVAGGSLGQFQQESQRAAAPADAAYNKLSGGTQGVIPGMNPNDVRALRASAKHEAQTNPISPAAVVPKLAGELASVGPGLVSTAISAYHHPIRTAEQVGKATYHSFGESIHHPGRQLGNDPLGLLSNLSAAFAAPGAVAGRAAAVSDAARAADVGTLAKVGRVAKAAVQQPRPVERTLVTARDKAGVATHAVHPLGSINFSMGMLQKHVIDPVHQYALDHPQSVPAKVLNNRLVGSQVKVGREIRASERVKTAAAQAPAGEIARAAKKLTAAEAKAVLIKASGRPAEDWAALEQHAISQGIGIPKAQRAQLVLTKAAMKHVDSPRVQAAADAMGKAMDENGDLKGIPEEEQLQRLGAHSLAIDHGAKGFAGLNPAQELHDLETSLASINGDSAIGRAQTREQQLGAQVAKAEVRQPGDNLIPRYMGGAGDTPNVAALRALHSAAKEDVQRAAARHPYAGDTSQIESRINELRSQLVGEGRRVKEAGGFYTPMLRESKPLRNALSGLAGGRGSKYGMSAAVREQKGYPYEGGMLARGDYKTDVGRVTATTYRNTQSVAQARRVHQLLYDMGKPSKEEAGGERFAEAVRPTQAVSESLKRMANTETPLKTPKGEHGLAEAVKSWYDETQAKPGEDIRYVDRRMLAPLRPYEPLMGKVGEGIDKGNQLIRVGRYLLPRYLQWLPQNVAFTAPRQGFWMARNAAKWKTEFPKLDPGVRDKIFSVMGHGPSQALAGDSKFLGDTQARLAHFWNTVNDMGPRAMAWIHEAESAGFHNAQGYTRLVTDPKLEQKLVEVTRRANKEAGDYSLSNVERATLKKLVPSWAWDKAASQYVGRLLIEHPYLSRFLATEGSQGQQQVDAFFQHLHGLMPSWLAGVLPLSTHSGFETSGISPTDTPAQLLQVGAGLMPGNKAERTPAQELAPIPAGVVEAATGHTLAGKPQSFEQTLLKTAEKFGPAREVATAVGKPGLFAAGPKAAILDALGSPVEQVDMRKAAKSGLTNLGTQAQKDAAARQKALEETGAMIRQTDAPPEWRKAYMVGTAAEVDRTQAKDAARRALPSGKKLPEARSYQITMETLVKNGMMDQQQYKRAMAAVPHMTGHQLTYWERRAWDDLGPGRILSKFRSYHHKLEEQKQKPVGAQALAATG